MIMDNAAKNALQVAQDEELKLNDYCVCFPYTYVIVEGPKGKSMGVALTLFEEFGDIEFRQPPPIDEWTLEHMIEASKSHHIVAKTLGVAAINAVSQYVIAKEEISETNAVDVVLKHLEPGSIVAIIGFIKPAANKLTEAGYRTIIFERKGSIRRDDALPDFLEPRFLKQADAAIITGAAYLNETLDVVLSYLRNDAYPVVLAGPTAQVHKDFLGTKKVTHVSSIKIFNPEEAAKWLRRGSSTGMKENSIEYTLPPS